MANQVQKITQEAMPQVEHVVVVSEVPTAAVEEEPKHVVELVDGDGPSVASCKEESSGAADLTHYQKMALQELKHLVQEAVNKNEFGAATEQQKQSASAREEKLEKESIAVAEAEVATSASDAVDDDGAKTVEAIEETVIVSVSSSGQKQQPAANAMFPEESKDAAKTNAQEEVSMGGMPLLADERSDVILLKFLRARDFKVKDAFDMLKNSIRWRKEFGIEELVEQDLGVSDLDKVVFMHGFDKEGHPVCYNVYGEFQNKELYNITFSNEEKRSNFLRWRIQFLEKSVRKLDFRPGGICSIVQVNDLKNAPGPGKWELRQATRQALQLLQDNYPEFVAKQVFINVPWWYLAVSKIISPFFTKRSKSKFVVVGPSKSAETLFRYIAAEQVPVKYGGLPQDSEFANTDVVTMKPAAKHTIEFPVTERCVLTWEIRVVGWNVRYGTEFVPSCEESYTVTIDKPKLVGAEEETVVICNSFNVNEAGKAVVTIDNPASNKKNLLYRSKTKPISSEVETRA